jgi:hypothetical protein
LEKFYGSDAAQLQQPYHNLLLIHSRNAASTAQVLESKNNGSPTPCIHAEQQFAKPVPGKPNPPAAAVAMLHNP